MVKFYALFPIVEPHELGYNRLRCKVNVKVNTVVNKTVYLSIGKTKPA